MRKIGPILDSTSCSPDGHEWLPIDFHSFLIEFQHIVSSCCGREPEPFFRGHADRFWRLDSTFVRNFISAVELERNQRLPQELRQSTAFNTAIKRHLPAKFGYECKPSQELLDLEKKENADPWFEFLKNLQQAPHTDSPELLKGTFIIDWTLAADIALFFANENRTGDGSLWIYDHLEKGGTLNKPVQHLIDLMRGPKFFEDNIYEPIVLYPKIQIVQQRAKNQESVYIAQTDYRYDLADIWVDQGRRLNNKRLFVNLILVNGTQNDCEQYLQDKGITEEFVYNKYENDL